jgi:hypothetical protein
VSEGPGWARALVGVRLAGWVLVPGWCCARGPEHGLARAPPGHDLSLQPLPAEIDGEECMSQTKSMSLFQPYDY